MPSLLGPPPPPTPPLPMFEADSQNFASVPSVSRGFEPKKFRPAFGEDHRGSQPTPPPPPLAPFITSLPSPPRPILRAVTRATPPTRAVHARSDFLYQGISGFALRDSADNVCRASAALRHEVLCHSDSGGRRPSSIYGQATDGGIPRGEQR